MAPALDRTDKMPRDSAVDTFRDFITGIPWQSIVDLLWNPIVSMPWQFIAGLLVATGGAIVSGFAVQFFTYYREQRDEMDELVDTLRWIQLLDTEEIRRASETHSYVSDRSKSGGNISMQGREGYHVWRLRDRLYDAYEGAHPRLNQNARDSVQDVLAWYISISRGNNMGTRPDWDRNDKADFESLDEEETYVSWEESVEKMHSAAKSAIDEINTLSITECFRDFVPFFERQR